MNFNDREGGYSMVSTDQPTFGVSLEERLKWLAEFSRDPGGGVSRLLYTSTWVKTQHALKQWFEEKGLVASFDRVGNLYGRLEGTTYKEETILTGSHIDTVKNGGMYDGQFGIVAGLFAIDYLKENYGAPLRNLEVVSMAEEEGSRFPFTFWGSKNIVGKVSQADVENSKDVEGITFSQAINESGFTYQTSDDVRKDIKGFVELHVEQGNVLEKEGKQVGVVHHIVGQRRMTVQVNGQANHAGTTPMGYRSDAMNIVSEIATRMYSLARKYGDPLVATIGQLTLEPNVVNVIPGKAVFSIDIRHTDRIILDEFTDEVKQIINNSSEEHGASIQTDVYLAEDPIQMDRELVWTIVDQCKKNKIDYKDMHSGAGHDAQIFAPHVPTAMVFVPSHRGISHSSEEYTEPKDLAAGVEALIRTLYVLGYKE